MVISRPFSVARLVSGVALLALASSVTLGAGFADPVLYRIFLNDGGALMLFERAHEQLDRALEFPEIVP